MSGVLVFSMDLESAINFNIIKIDQRKLCEIPTFVCN